MHSPQRHPRYMGSFVDFWVGMPKFAGHMKLILICFAFLTRFFLLCFRHSLLELDLLGGCRTRSGPLDVVIPSSRGVSIFSTGHSILSTLVLFLVTKFAFLEVVPTGPSWLFF